MQSSNPYNAPDETVSPAAPVAPARSMRIKSIDPLAAGKLLGALYALLGLIFGLFMALFAVLGVAVGGGDAAIGGVLTGLGSIIFIPLLYGIAGFIGGIITALLYNLVAGMIGGLVMEIEI